MICIYKATNRINGKVYIGKTNNFKARKLAHETKPNDHLFSRAIQKYGKENFDWVILEDGITSLEESNERERYWIAKYRSYFRWKDSNGYNMTRGGDGGGDWNIRKVAAYSLDGILVKAFDSVSECAEYKVLGMRFLVHGIHSSLGGKRPLCLRPLKWKILI